MLQYIYQKTSMRQMLVNVLLQQYLKRRSTHVLLYAVPNVKLLFSVPMTSLIYAENIYINKSVILKDNRITIQEFGSAQD